MSSFPNQDWFPRPSHDDRDSSTEDGLTKENNEENNNDNHSDIHKGYTMHSYQPSDSSEYLFSGFEQETQPSTQEPLFARRGIHASVSKQLGLTLAGSKQDLSREQKITFSPSSVGLDNYHQAHSGGVRTPSVLLSAPTTPSLQFDGGQPPSSSSSSSFAITIPPSFTSKSTTSAIPLVRSRSTSSTSAAHRSKKVATTVRSKKQDAGKSDSRRPSISALATQPYDFSSVAQTSTSPFPFSFSQAQSQQSTPNLTGQSPSFGSTASYFPTPSNNTTHSGSGLANVLSVIGKGQGSNERNHDPTMINAAPSSSTLLNQNAIVVIPPTAASFSASPPFTRPPHDPIMNLLSMTSGSGNGLVHNGAVGELMISKSLSSVAESAAKIRGPFIASTSVAVAASAAVAVNRRVSAACNFCKVRKLRCSGQSPCQQCSRRSLSCVFSKEAEIRKKRKRAATVSEGTGHLGSDSGSARLGHGKDADVKKGSRTIVYPFPAQEASPLLNLPMASFSQQTPSASSLFSFTDPTSALAISSHDFAAASAMRPQQVHLMHNTASAWPDQTLSDWALEELGLHIVKSDGADAQTDEQMPSLLATTNTTMLPFGQFVPSASTHHAEGHPPEDHFHIPSTDDRTRMS